MSKEDLIRYGEPTGHKVDKKGKITCQCGSTSIQPLIYTGDNEDHEWVYLGCRKCRRSIFYNGA